MMNFWQELIDDWYRKFRQGDPNVNCYQGAHLWEGILYPDAERRIMDQLKKKGIRSYAVFTSSTPLDRSAARFYKTIGIKVQLAPSQSSFDHSYYVGTYGDLIVQIQYPPTLVKKLDAFFRKNKSIDDLDVTELAELANQRCEVKLTVIRNLAMAQQINKSIMSQME
jgi:hypothetical protein